MAKPSGPKTPSKNKPSIKKISVTCDSDFEADELVPQYLETKAKLLEHERGVSQLNGSQASDAADEELVVAKLEAKVRKIEADVLFDKYVVEQQWKAQKIELEQHFAELKRKQQSIPQESSNREDLVLESKPEDDVNNEAERIAAEILAEAADEGEDGLSGLFDSLPQSEVDATTGQSRAVVNSADGTKIAVRDFGKWTGVNPRRALEEACRSR